uniref:Uncharacterized protein n=1 Tax=Rhizophora mucronata TaxID=61149 RepID=A0A2P2J0L0_RHIMU
MADKEMASREDEPRKPQTPFALFPKFHIAIPFLNQPKKAESGAGKEAKNSVIVIPEEGESERIKRENENHRPSVVSFPERRPIIPPSLDVEVEESSGRTQNPIVIWQKLVKPSRDDVCYCIPGALRLL